MKTKTKTKTKPAFAVDAGDYLAEVRRELDAYFALMDAAWHFRPDLAVSAEACLVVSTDFNIKGFLHKGRKVYVRASAAAGYRNPRAVARGIVAELVSHRNTCKECGVDVLPLQRRLYVLEKLLEYGREDCRRRIFGKKNVDAVDDGSALVPPDAVERAVWPRVCARVDAAQAAAAAAAAEREPDEYQI